MKISFLKSKEQKILDKINSLEGGQYKFKNFNDIDSSGGCAVSFYFERGGDIYLTEDERMFLITHTNYKGKTGLKTPLTQAMNAVYRRLKISDDEWNHLIFNADLSASQHRTWSPLAFALSHADECELNFRPDQWDHLIRNSNLKNDFPHSNILALIIGDEGKLGSRDISPIPEDAINYIIKNTDFSSDRFEDNWNLSILALRFFQNKTITEKQLFTIIKKSQPSAAKSTTMFYLDYVVKKFPRFPWEIEKIIIEKDICIYKKNDLYYLDRKFLFSEMGFGWKKNNQVAEQKMNELTRFLDEINIFNQTKKDKHKIKNKFQKI